MRPNARPFRPRRGPVQPDALGMPFEPLSATQKAVIALDSLPLFEAEAKARQGTRNDLVALMPPSESRKAREDAAQTFHVSPRYVQDAKAIQAKAPDLLPALRSGDTTITPEPTSAAPSPPDQAEAPTPVSVPDRPAQPNVAPAVPLSGGAQ